MQDRDKGVELVLIADDPQRATLLRDAMRKNGINGVIRRLAPGPAAVACARHSGAYANKGRPDLVVYDYSDPSEHNTAVLRDVAFCSDRSRVPVVLLTSPTSQDLLETGDIDGDTAVMFSPTSLMSFVRKMKAGKRKSFFHALNTLYQYGPILVRLPETCLSYSRHALALTA